MRIFHDRLIDDQDREYLKEILAQQFEKFEIEKDQVLNVERIIFGDFLQGREVETRHYQ
jgi:dynein heavy chain